MNLRYTIAAMACGILMVCTGCTTTHSVTRGQSPYYTGTPDSVEQAGYRREMRQARREQMANPGFGGPQAGQVSTPEMPGIAPNGYAAPFNMPSTYADQAYGQRPQSRQERRAAKLASRGIYPPTYTSISTDVEGAEPATTVDGVEIYNGYQLGGQTGACRHGIPDAFPGGCPYCRADYIRWMPKHYHSFTYDFPNDLTYPAPNAPGGAIVYPYYTVKGPSDFFRDE